MKQKIRWINIIICVGCLMLILLDRLLPDRMFFDRKPAKIVALVACASTWITACMEILKNRKRARRRANRCRRRTGRDYN